MTAALTVVEAPATLESLPLSDLAEVVRQEHALVAQAGATMVEHAIRAGDALRTAKAHVQRGGWEAWLGQEFPDKHPKTLRLYMRLSKFQERVREAQPASIVHAQRMLAFEAIRPHEDELREEAHSLHQQGLTQKDIAAQLGVSHYAVASWLNPKLREQRRAKKNQQSKAARRALHDKQRKAAVARVGGPISHAYGHVRKALDALQEAADGQLDREARQAVHRAIGRLHTAEDLIVKASKLS
jgi:hypothetical protein